MFQESEYYSFIEISKNKAKDVLALFFSRLGYSDLFNHLFDSKKNNSSSDKARNSKQKTKT